MKKITDLFFYACSKGRFPDNRGSVFVAVFLGLIFPVMLAVCFLYHIAHGLFCITIQPIVVVMAVFLILILIYFYYKHNNRGEKIIDHFENTKYDRWYYLLGICILGQLFIGAFIIAISQGIIHIFEIY